jgi:hypothetical protein
VPYSLINTVWVLKNLKNSKKSNLVVYFMYHILNFYTIVFLILLFKNNSKMIKSEIVVLIKRENWYDVDESKINPNDHWNQPNKWYLCGTHNW